MADWHLHELVTAVLNLAAAVGALVAAASATWNAIHAHKARALDRDTAAKVDDLHAAAGLAPPTTPGIDRAEAPRC